MQDDYADSAFAFEGSWKEFAPIAFTNLLLTIVTLGIYRFWATARERRYLWSRTRFVDETLEWSGNGLEMFVGFALVMVLIFLPFFGLNLLAQRLVFQGQQVAGLIVAIAPFVLLFYLGGVARFRALRYRLSRTRWRGIRGGSDDNGFGYGLSYAWKTIVGYLPIGLMVPWALADLWNQRWNRMSFGPHAFKSNATSNRIYGRYLLFYLTPFVVFLAFMVVGLFFGGFSAMAPGEGPASPGTMIGAIFALAIIFYAGLGLIAVAFYAKYYREMIGALQWRSLRFGFDARTVDWVKLLLGDVALVIFTLGIGSIFLSYRHWKFFVTNLEADGEIVLDELTQSTTRMAGTGEGMLDAFDIGAI